MSIADAVAGGPLRRGSSGGGVVALQHKLSGLGYTLQPDGEFGPITEIAVKQFQSSAALISDGIVGPVTARALDLATPAPIQDGAIIYVDAHYGLGDEATSAGMDVLAAAIRAMSPRFIVRRTDSWRDWESSAARIRARPRTSRNTLIGNSMGANVIPLITGECPNHKFELVVGYDPTWAWTNVPLTFNIVKAIQYRGTNFFSLIGKARWVQAFAGQLIEKTTSILHSRIDDALDLHADTLKHFRALLAK